MCIIFLKHKINALIFSFYGPNIFIGLTPVLIRKGFSVEWLEVKIFVWKKRKQFFKYISTQIERKKIRR